MSPRFWIASGAFLAAVAVTLGAMGTHILKEAHHWPESDLATFEVGVRYQMYHALGMILVGLLAAQRPSRWWSVCGTAFLAGIVLFSGGLYLWLATEQKPFVQIVPIGGVAWIVGWLILTVAALVAFAPRRDAK